MPFIWYKEDFFDSKNTFLSLMPTWDKNCPSLDFCPLDPFVGQNRPFCSQGAVNSTHSAVYSSGRSAAEFSFVPGLRRKKMWLLQERILRGESFFSRDPAESNGFLSRNCARCVSLWLLNGQWTAWMVLVIARGGLGHDTHWRHPGLDFSLFLFFFALLGSSRFQSRSLR